MKAIGCEALYKTKQNKKKKKKKKTAKTNTQNHCFLTH